MANLKSITELPVAESATDLNLIVNDNGAAKQIPASAVGAQADFAVTDETSPAFIKNKPAIAQADWSQNDENAPDYVKNRTHYDTRVVVTSPNVTVSGTITEWGYLKIADTIDFDINRLMSVTASSSCGIKYVDATVTIGTECEGAYGVIMGDGTWLFAWLPTQEAADNWWADSENANPFTSGLYMYTDCDDNEEEVTVAYSFTYFISGELKKLEAKYVEDMYGTKITEDVEILAETTIEIPEESFIELQTPMVLDLASGMNYTINWNGNSYVCKANFDGEWFWLEALDVFTIYTYPYIFNNEGYYAEIEVYDGSTSVTLSIIGPSAEVKKIDVKYMPDEVQDNISDLYNSVNYASSTANAAQTTANAAQTTANAAQTTANAAQTTANNKMDKNNPTGTGSFSMNRRSGTTTGAYSHAEGYSTTASQNYSHAEGETTIASATASHAEGSQTNASGSQSHAEGKSTTASGNSSHAEGADTTASGDYSHAEGKQTNASGSYSHTEGKSTTASGNSSHAEGATTNATGNYSHAEGSQTNAFGHNSHTEGKSTTASGRSSHVQGEYNILDTEGSANTKGKYVHIVGNGTSDTARSNAHTLDWSGNAWYQGTVEGTGFILASPNGTRFKITVADNGTLSTVAV